MASAQAGTTVAQAGELRSARIESLRAIGALGILLGHTWYDGQVVSGNPAAVNDTFIHRLPLSGGLGIALLFALSGHLMFWPFAQRLYGDRGKIDLKVYGLNRAYRILPLYWTVLAVLLILGHNGGSFTQWWRFLLFAQNYSLGTVGTVDGPMWSLVVEVQFYILLPILAWLLLKLSRRDRRVGAAILALLALASLWLHWHYVDNALFRDPRKEYSLPLQFGFLCSGMLVAVLRTAWRDGPPAWLVGPLRNADVWLLASIPFWAIAVHDYRYIASTTVASALMIGACVLPLRPGMLAKALDQRWLVTVGVASYSLYLWHIPVLEALDGTFKSFWSLFAVGVPLCIAVALLSYRLVEEPFLRRRKRWSASAPAHVEAAPEPVAS